ncbi:MAG: exodeoxyribonuclease VII small subunit [Clostridiales bacterium]|nr:exodeoxyribonuclease VII small subunit [Clostridiales bacterium]
MEKNKYSKLSYEEAIAELEKIIQKLENGQVGLEDSLELYKEGTQLAALCSDKLAAAEKKIMMLTRSSAGEMVESDFETEEEDGR